MKTKEEILMSHCGGSGEYIDDNVIDCYRGSVDDAMDEHAREVAVYYAHSLIQKIGLSKEEMPPETAYEAFDKWIKEQNI